MNKLLKSFLFTTILSSTMSLDTEVGFNFDNNQSPLSGSRNIASFVSIGSSIFDKRIPKNSLIRTGSIYIQTACNTFLHLLNHEYYGHGSAFKNIEIGLKEIQIGFTSFGFPIEGHAKFEKSPKNIDDSILVSTSGSQANTYYSQQQILNNFNKKKIDFFLLNSMFTTNTDSNVYMIRAKIRSKNEANYPMDDILNWKNKLKDKYSKEVINFNDSYIYVPASLALISPISIMTLLGTFNYIYYGENYTEWLCFKSGNFKYLPNFRTETTPFGLAYAIDNFFAYNERTFLFSFSGLNDPYKRFIFTFDLRSNNLFTSEFVDFDLRSVFARQPIEEVDETTLVEDKGTFFGYMIQPSLRLKLNKFKIYLDYTMKNSVFIPAAPYREGHYFNVGFSYTFDA